jgi:hypothetical protein
MKNLVQSPQVLTPLDLEGDDNSESDPNKRIFVVTDASLVGTGGWIS